jgi:hypothetical protein
MVAEMERQHAETVQVVQFRMKTQDIIKLTLAFMLQNNTDKTPSIPFSPKYKFIKNLPIEQARTAYDFPHTG